MVVSIDFSRPVWVYGAGSFGRAVAAALQKQGATLSGFISAKNPGSEIDGLPVVAPQAASGQVAIGVFSRENPYPDIAATCAAAGLDDLHWPMTYYPALAADLGWRYWLGAQDTFATKASDIEKACSLLSDDQSRANFRGIISFRQGDNPGYAGHLDDEPQYFPPFLTKALPAEPTFVDCGAFDGDTYRAFSELATKHTAILFEPEPTNFAALVANLRATANTNTVLTIPLAVSDRHRTLYFSGDGEAAGASEKGIPVVAVSLDDTIHRPIHYLKMDIEGAEADALNGGRRVISEYRPIIAISLYHKQADLWELPLLVNDIVEGYAYFIRQHSHNSFESVLYAMPRERLST